MSATLYYDWLVSPTAYDATDWNGVDDIAPSKNAVRDKIEAVVAAIPDVTGYITAAAVAAGYQAKDTELTAIAGLTSAADKTIEFTGSGTAGTYTVTAAAKTVLDDSTVDAMLTTLGGAAYTGTGGISRIDSPTFTTLIGLLSNGLATTVTDSTAIKACNTTASTVGVPVQYSPAVLWEGQCWETTGGTSQSVKNRVILQPVSGATATYNLLFQRSINGSGYTTFLTIGSNGAVTSTNIVSAASYLTTAGFLQVGAAQYILIDTRLRLQASASGVATLTRSDGTTPAQLTLGSVVRKRQDYAPSAAGTASLLCLLGDKHRIQMPSGNITIAFSSVAVDQTLTISIKQDATGSRTVTWPAGISWAGGSAPTLTTTANKTDTIVIECTASGVYEGYVAGANI